MVSFFYSADYTASKYGSSAPLLHAQVAIMADKYDCASLFALANKSLAHSIEGASVDDWVTIAALVYGSTTSSLAEHVALRKTVVEPATRNARADAAFFQHAGVEDLLRSSADLATDLLFSGARQVNARNQVSWIFVCDHCKFTHTGSRTCPNSAVDTFGKETCPDCHQSTGAASPRTIAKVKTSKGVSCDSCQGIHTPKSRQDPPGW